MPGKSTLGRSLSEYNRKKIIAICVIPKIDKDKDVTMRSSSFDSKESVFLTVREVKKTTIKPKA